MSVQVIIVLFSIVLFSTANGADWPPWLAGKNCTNTRIHNKSDFNITVRIVQCSENGDPTMTEKFIPEGYGEWFPGKIGSVVRIYKNVKGVAQKEPWAFDVEDSDAIIYCTGTYNLGVCAFDPLSTLAPNQQVRARDWHGSNVYGIGKDIPGQSKIRVGTQKLTEDGGSVNNDDTGTKAPRKRKSKRKKPDRN